MDRRMEDALPMLIYGAGTMHRPRVLGRGRADRAPCRTDATRVAHAASSGRQHDALCTVLCRRARIGDHLGQLVRTMVPNPTLAKRVTGMLLDLPMHELMPLLDPFQMSPRGSLMPEGGELQWRIEQSLAALRHGGGTLDALGDKDIEGGADENIEIDSSSGVGSCGDSHDDDACLEEGGEFESAQLEATMEDGEHDCAGGARHMPRCLAPP